MIIVTYTHSNVFDVVPYYISRLKKHCSLYENVFFSNKPIEGSKCFVYHDSLPFSSEYSRLLNMVDSEFVLFSQEDQILYNDVDVDKIEKIKTFLSNSDFDYCRLIRQQSELINVSNSLYLSNNLFSMQPTIWKRSALLSIMSSVVVDKIFGENEFSVIMNRYKGLFFYNEEEKRGISHYDSSIWPYIATAIVKGKWNVSEYKQEIAELFNEFQIKTDRGFR